MSGKHRRGSRRVRPMASREEEVTGRVLVRGDELELALEELRSASVAVAEQTARRDVAVRKVRELGGSWSKIARAADMTPQGAHAKWRERSKSV